MNVPSKKIRREGEKKILELNENENIAYKNLWDTMKMLLRAIYSYKYHIIYQRDKKT